MNLNWTTIYHPLICHFIERPCSREKVKETAVRAHLRPTAINLQTVKCRHTTLIAMSLSAMSGETHSVVKLFTGVVVVVIKRS